MTNIVEFQTRASLEQQACEWLTRLDGDNPLSAAEIQALHEWMNRSSLHAEELKRISQFWKQANVLTELAVPLNGRDQESSGYSRRRLLIAAAASALLGSVILLSGWFQRSDGATNGTYATAIGQQQTVSLPDGSSVQLNTDTQVQVDYSKRSRTIRLLRGEALFAVTKDQRRAFDVCAADGIVRAVGTAFSVHLDGNRVNVTVSKGVVDVSEVGSAQPIATRAVATGQPTRKLGRLKAGEMATFGPDTQRINVSELEESELRRRMAWREGYLVFSGEPLSEVVEQLNRYSPIILHIADPKLASTAIGGRFRIGDLDAILDVLRTNFDIRSSRVKEREIQLEPAHLAEHSAVTKQ